MSSPASFRPPTRVGVYPFALFAVLLCLVASTQAQSDPATFADVFNIGTVPPGSPLDVPGAVTGASVGGGSNTTLTPADLTGDILGDDSQLNLFDGGTITGTFDVGPSSTFGFLDLVPPQNVGLNTEINVFGGATDLLIVNANARASINGGDIGILELRGGSVVTINGGNIGVGGAGVLFPGVPFPGFVANPDTVVEINGGTFTNGFNATIGSVVTVNGGSFSAPLGDDFVSSNSLTVTDGTFGDSFAAVGTLDVTGGSFGNGLNIGTIGAGTTTATFANTTVGSGFSAISSNTVVEISNSTFGDNFISGGELTITSGVFGSNLSASSGPTNNITISGGVFGEDFTALGNVTFSGGEFQRNGVATTDLSAGLARGSNDVVSGVLADGNVFIFAGEALDEFSPGTVAQVVAVAPSTNPGVLSSGVFGQGVRSGETLTVNGAGQLADDFAVVGGTLNIDGGSVGNGLEAAFSQVNITGGSVAGGFRAFDGTTVNISGGNIGFGIGAFSGSTINLSGGNTLQGFFASAGSEVNVNTGGSIGADFGAFGAVNINGGSIGAGFTAFSGSTVTITEGSIGADFSVLGFATANIEGGDIGDLSAGPFSAINLSDGTINGSFGLTGIADISGGTFNGAFSVSNNPTASGITGVANISGGSFNGSIFATGDGTLNVSGGSFNSNLTFIGGALNLVVTQVLLDGVELTDLVEGEVFTIEDRNVPLTGVLADGSPFAFDLNNVFTADGDSFLNATITVTLVPEPSSLLLLSLGGLALLSRRKRS